MKKIFKKGIITPLAVSLAFMPVKSATGAEQNTKSDDEKTMVIEEIVVTSRKRAENLQSVPDSITAFSAADIEKAGIGDVEDFINLTPNLSIRETFRAGVTFITMRGITTGQQGWAPVTYVVDGVQAGSLDAINQGALFDIERIEVLKGPQGALYGAGAIAGAINVITKKPNGEPSAAAKFSYGNGNDFKISARFSGALSEDKVFFQIGGYYRTADGLIKSTDGAGLDFEDQVTLRGRLIFDLDDLVIDLRASYTDIEAGAAAQEMLPKADLLEVFDTVNAPGPARGIIGKENRKIAEFSAKIDYETDAGTFTSVTGFSDMDQDLFGSVSFAKPPTPTLLGFSVGNPGDNFTDAFQDLQDNIESFTQDVRFTSDSEQPLRWHIGASYHKRRILNFLSVGALTKGLERVEGNMTRFLNRPDVREDKVWGVYVQVNYDLTDKLELSAALRYDKNDLSTTQYKDLTLKSTVATPDGIVTQEKKDRKWQPKIQLSYDWSDDVATAFWTIF